MRITTGHISGVLIACLLMPASAHAIAILATQVHGVDPGQGIVAFLVGRDQGVALDDRFWVFQGEMGAAWGSIYYVDETGCAGRIAGTGHHVEAGAPASIALYRQMSEARMSLPPGTTLQGAIRRIPPGRGVAWVDLGAWSGLREGDALLIERRSIPIARGEVALLEDRQALAVLSPLLTNARAEAGDLVRLWPSPHDRRVGSVETVVMDVHHEGQVPQFRFVSPDHQQLTFGRVGELYRGRSYVGLASVTETGSPLSRAEMDLEASLPAPEGLPQVGDRMILRSSPPRRDVALRAAVFRIERLPGEPHDYALIAAGEQDGVKQGDRFLVAHRHPQDPHLKTRVAELVVRKVNISYSGAEVHDLQPGDDERVKPWDMAERTVPAEMRWENVGIVTDMVEEARIGWADVDDRVPLRAGEIVRWEADPDSPRHAGIILYRHRHRVALWVPPGWGSLSGLRNAGIDARGALAVENPREVEAPSN